MNNPIRADKNVQNYISAAYPDGHTEILFTPLAPFETPEALDRICEEYNRVIGNMEAEPLIAIPVFIHDFLCIHPSMTEWPNESLAHNLFCIEMDFMLESIFHWKQKSHRRKTFITMP